MMSAEIRPFETICWMSSVSLSFSWELFFMGSFYVNYTLRGVTQDAVAKALGGRTCVVTPSAHDTVVAFDEESDERDLDVISSLATALSQKLRCPVLAVLNHDDDVFWYRLYRDGKLQDEYDSSPGYFDANAEPSAPAGGDAAKLCAAFGSANVEEVEGVLRRSSFDDDGYAFAFERHGDLVAALGISAFGVGSAYASFENDELPEGLSASDVVRTA
jgi:hypothetical protein